MCFNPYDCWLHVCRCSKHPSHRCSKRANERDVDYRISGQRLCDMRFASPSWLLKRDTALMAAPLVLPTWPVWSCQVTTMPSKHIKSRVCFQNQLQNSPYYLCPCPKYVTTPTTTPAPLGCVQNTHSPTLQQPEQRWRKPASAPRKPAISGSSCLSTFNQAIPSKIQSTQ